MKKDWIARELTMEIVVGVFMVMIFLGLGYFTIILSRETWFGTKFPFEVVFEDVMGLRDGDSVVVRGMPIGKVKMLHLEDDGVHVMSTLDQDVRLRKEYRITIVSTSILGGRYLNIDEGPATNDLLPADMAFKGEAPYDLMADAAELVNAAKEHLVEGGVLDNLQQASVQINEIAERLNRGEGTIGKLLSSDDTLYRDLTNMVAAARQVAEGLADGEGTIGRLLSDEDTLYDDLNATVTALKTITQRLEKGEGTLGRLMASDDALYEDMAATMASLKAVAEKLEKGEGLLGQLIGDEALSEDVKGAIQEMREAIDDMRETAPVVTFTSIFFGAF